MSWLSDFLARLFRPAPAPTPTPQPAAGMLAALNRRRGELGLPPLVASALLPQVAQNGALDMARRGVLSHRRSDGRMPQDVARGLGYHGLVGECAAMGQATAEQAVESWMADRPHREVLTDGRYFAAGWASADGRGGRCWCIDLGTV